VCLSCRGPHRKQAPFIQSPISLHYSVACLSLTHMSVLISPMLGPLALHYAVAAYPSGFFLSHLNPSLFCLALALRVLSIFLKVL
jgi:hypothetical protein